MHTPNLFDCGTSELTQDAVLCWVLRWADGRYSDVDPPLHRMARELLGVLFQATGRALPSDALSLTVRTQVDNIDVVAWVGDDFLLGIEDKTDSGPHGGQLVRYKAKLEDMVATEGRVVLPVYVKTGEINRGAQVRGQGWHPVGRAQLLSVFRRAAAVPAPNDIVADYTQWLEARERDASIWLREPDLNSWGSRGWQGLYAVTDQRTRDNVAARPKSPTPARPNSPCMRARGQRYLFAWRME